MQERKLQKDTYKQTHSHMGIFRIKNKVNNKVLVSKSMDIAGAMNRLKFEFKTKSHRNKELQADMMKYGEENFVFEVLESIKPEEEVIMDVSELNKYHVKLDQLEKKWLETLKPYGEKGYNPLPRELR